MAPLSPCGAAEPALPWVILCKKRPVVHAPVDTLLSPPTEGRSCLWESKPEGGLDTPSARGCSRASDRGPDCNVLLRSHGQGAKGAASAWTCHAVTLALHWWGQKATQGPPGLCRPLAIVSSL